MLFPHDKLDWTISRLERHLDSQPDDIGARTEYAVASLSRAWFHDGGEVWHNQALTQARRVLHHDPGNARALVVAGLALTHLDRLEPASRYLDQAVRSEPEAATVHLALGELHLAQNERHQAVREFEFACRQAADSWEPHAQLGLLLRQRATELGHPPRVLERSQYHLVCALQLSPSQAWKPRLLMELSLACLQTGRLPDAHKLLTRLVDNPTYRAKARYHLGLVAMHMGKYKNAVLHLRQHLQEHGDSPHVHAKIALCYLQLGELRKAREACNHALALDPVHVDPRWTLGCTLLEEESTDEAIRLFKEILHDAPDHLPAFRELVRIRQMTGDGQWLLSALRAEVSHYDRMPLAAQSPSGEPIRPRESVRARIELIMAALAEVGDTPEDTLLESLALTTDEGLRARLWEFALDVLAQARAMEGVRWLSNPGRYFNADRGHEVVALAPALPEDALRRGLQLSEEDLQRAAVDRHGPANDVVTHRRRVEQERQQARAWQALILIGMAESGTESGRNLLLRWATEADPELAIAARAGLALTGDAHATDALRAQADQAGQSTSLARLLSHREPVEDRASYRPISDDEDRTCATCGRRTGEVEHMMVRDTTALCDRCLATVARRRQELSTDDPRVQGALTGKTLVEARAIYVYNGIAVAESVVEHSLGLAEREEVGRFLAGW
ncbi:MAG: tetratricopeptide repeat protein [Myxococcota bacterium]